MTHTNKLFLPAVAAMALGLLLTACVDHDYDLKDIDMTVQLGGDDLAIPQSSTDFFSLAKILNLDEESSIKADENGNYSLIQDGDQVNFYVKIENVNLNKITDSSTDQDVYLPCGDYSEGEKFIIYMGTRTGVDDRLHACVKEMVNTIDVAEDDVTKEIVSITEVDTHLDMNVSLRFNFDNYDGDVTIMKGFKVDFDPTMSISCNADYITVVDNHTLVFNRDYYFNKHTGARGPQCVLPVAISHFVMTGTNGIDENHNFSFVGNVISSGEIALDASRLSSVADLLNINIVTHIMPVPYITQVIGTFDPVIDINPTVLNINDIPDFLKDDDNNMDLLNPQLYLTVNNSTSVIAGFCLELTSSRDNALLAKVLVGERDKNYPLIVKPGKNIICISVDDVPIAEIKAKVDAEGVPDANILNYKQANLAELINVIPDKIDVDTYAKADSKHACTIKLFDENEDGYHLDFDSKAIVPLAFGENAVINYSKTDVNWDEVLYKYGFHTAVIKAKAISTLPLDLTPEVEPIFVEGKGYGPCGDVTTKIEGVVKGTADMNQPAESDLIITLTSTSGSLNGLDGIEYKFKSVSDAALQGVLLNEKMGILLRSVNITIPGGLIIDLNNHDDDNDK